MFPSPLNRQSVDAFLCGSNSQAVARWGRYGKLPDRKIIRPCAKSSKQQVNTSSNGRPPASHPVPSSNTTDLDVNSNSNSSLIGKTAGRYETDLDIFSDDFACSSTPSTSSDSGNVDAGVESQSGGNPTELIFKLERRGFGWGEEIIPHITLERRPIERKKKRQRNRSKGPNPWEKGSLEQFLLDNGVDYNQVNSVASAAVAWRVTPGGRPLIDRRRRSRVERNMKAVVKYLEDKCGVEPGPTGIGLLLSRAPQILLAKPTFHDRWYRRVIELAGFMWAFGHCNVPYDWEKSPTLAVWVKRQRAAKLQGTLTEEKLQILHALGFEFGEVVVITQEWEHSFDTLVEWVLWHTENGEPMNWLCFAWAKQGGFKAGQLAVWVEVQRELRRRKLLPKEAIQRLDTIGFEWNVPCYGRLDVWLRMFGKFLYAVERRKMKSRRRQAFSPDDIQVRGDSNAGSLFNVLNNGTPTNRPPSTSNVDNAFCNRDHIVRHRVDWKPAHQVVKLDKLTGVKFQLGVGYWFAKQRWLWRRGKLNPDMANLFFFAGVDLNGYGLQEWILLAHTASSFLNGYEILLHPEVSRVQPQSEESKNEHRLFLRPGEIQGVTQDGDVVVWSNTNNDARVLDGGNGILPPKLVSSALSLLQPEDPALKEEKSNGSGGNGAEAAGKLQNGHYDRTLVATRLQVRRWVLTQQMLWKESRLSQEQLRYLAFLGLTWVLSPDITHMSKDAWLSRFNKVCMECKDEKNIVLRSLYAPLRDWLMHQRGLKRLGWLSENRVQMLQELGLKWNFDDRTEQDKEWDGLLTKLLDYKRMHGDCKVPPESSLGVSLAKTLATNQLSDLQFAQIKALGVNIQQEEE